MRQQLRKIPFYPVFKMIQLAVNNGGIDFKRIPTFLGHLLKFIIFEPFRLAEVWLFDHKIRNHKLEQDPIFILGYWRSGTSHLQNVMSKNPRHKTTTIYNFLFADSYYLTESWLKRPINWFCRILGIKFEIQRIPMHMDIAAELDTEMLTFCSDYAYSWGFLFPKKYNEWMERLLYVEDRAEADGWIEDYDFLIKKLSYWHRNKRIVVKSPGDIARFKFLLEKYPNAKFIYVEREPMAVFHSNQYLWDILQRKNIFQQISQDQVDDYIIDTYKKVMVCYQEQRALLNENNLIEIRFKDLISKAEPTLRKVYKKLDLGAFPKAELLPFLEKDKTYKVNTYNTPPILKAKILKEWAFAFEEEEERV
jgi:hypothetical protein